MLEVILSFKLNYLILRKIILWEEDRYSSQKNKIAIQRFNILISHLILQFMEVCFSYNKEEEFKFNIVL